MAPSTTEKNAAFPRQDTGMNPETSKAAEPVPLVSTIYVRHDCVDLAGDLIAGIVLSEVVLWFLPRKKRRKRAVVERDGREWLSHDTARWQERCRVGPKELRRALTQLERKNLICTVPVSTKDGVVLYVAPGREVLELCSRDC